MSMTMDILLLLSPGEQEAILAHEHDDGGHLLWSQADEATTTRMATTAPMTSPSTRATRFSL